LLLGRTEKANKCINLNFEPHSEAHLGFKFKLWKFSPMKNRQFC
jgi:hypothetical protein